MKNQGSEKQAEQLSRWVQLIVVTGASKIAPWSLLIAALGSGISLGMWMLILGFLSDQLLMGSIAIMGGSRVDSSHRLWSVIYTSPSTLQDIRGSLEISYQTRSDLKVMEGSTQVGPCRFSPSRRRLHWLDQPALCVVDGERKSMSHFRSTAPSIGDLAQRLLTGHSKLIRAEAY